MRYIRFLLACLGILAGAPLVAKPDVRRLIVLGNGYELAGTDGALLQAIRAAVPMDSGTLVLYLGNNARPGDTATLRAEANLVAGTDARAIFIPGYLEWARGRRNGYKALRRQERFLKGLGDKQVKFYPSDGCPGPKKVELGNDAVLYLLDSEWWLYDGLKPDLESDCKYRTKEDILAEIEDIPKDEAGKLVLFASHHPLENTGVHSGTYGLRQHLFPLTDIRGLSHAYLPLPLIGSLYPVLGNAISTTQELQNPEYQRLAVAGIRTSAGITRAFESHPATVFLAGQEHNLQLLQRDGHYYINSGALGTPTRVRHGEHTVYARETQGITVLELSADKTLRARFYRYDDGKLVEDRVAALVDYNQLAPLAVDTASGPRVATDSVVAAIDPQMGRPSRLQRVLNGSNYRAEWATPVRMKVLHLDGEKGGLRPTGVGGGHESKSLQLKAADGSRWAFRRSTKDLAAVIPEGFQETTAGAYIEDMLSASHPYGGLVVPGLQEPLGILSAVPDVRFMPNDSAMDAYRPVFANHVGMLEPRKPARNDLGSVSTTEAFNSMVDAGDHTADQQAYLSVRWIDFLIADFDRHHGQYNWGRVDSAGRRFYYPIPKDRDQAFYHNRGLIMGIARRGAYSFQVNFPYRIKNMENMGLVGAYMDGLFTNQLTEGDWQQSLTRFRATLTDSIIDAAVRRMPPEIYALNGPTIAAKLKSRRESLAEKGMDYYRFISRDVNILGGNGDDVFRLSGTDSGTLVQVFARDKAGTPSLRYARTFDPHRTRELRLYGFNGDDRFEVDSSVRHGIRLRIVGGRGDDTFDIRGRARNLLYDLSTEDNYVLARRRTTQLFGRDASVNEFIFREERHDALSLPLVTFGFNSEDGVLAGIGLTYRARGFRKLPYASQHRFTASFASTNRAAMVRYQGEFLEAFRRYDLLINGNYYDPVLSNFFGFGNETVRDPARPVSYYRTRYDYIAGDVLLRRRFHRGNVMSVSAGPSLFYYWYDEKPNRSRVLEYPEQVGLDSSRVYARKFYAGGRINFTVNTLNSDLLPTRGIRWTNDFTALESLNDDAKPYSRFLSNLDLYAELDRPSRLLATLHFGGGHIFSKNFEYYQALTLGGNNYLRGYRINRFAGSSMAYASAELRLKLFDFNARILKADFGLAGFSDVGRVWQRGETSDKWHHGYGGGVYLIPFNAVLISALVGVSEEDALFNFSVGTKLNVVFQGM